MGLIPLARENMLSTRLHLFAPFVACFVLTLRTQQPVPAIWFHHKKENNAASKEGAHEFLFRYVEADV